MTQKTWKDLSDDQKLRTMEAAETYGGGFMWHLARAWMVADSENKLAIEKAFPEILLRYGPNSAFYRAA